MGQRGASHVPPPAEIAEREAMEPRILGLPPQQGRWLFVGLGLAIQLCLGTVYSWSVFKKPIEKEFTVGSTASSMPFILFLAFFALLMPFGGRFLQKWGPRNVGIVGGILVGAGWILSGFAPNLPVLYITYGVIAGAGVGLAYGGPLAVASRWFPDRKGLAVGLTVGGFGLSAAITAPLARWLIDQYQVMPTFTILGVAFLVITILLSLPLKFPKAQWKPAGWKGAAAAAAVQNIGPAAMIKTPQFYGVWACFLFGSLAGLMAIGIASPVGQEIVGLSAATSSVLVSVFAIFNFAGRPGFGWLTDKITPRNAAFVSFVLIGLASAGMLTAGTGDRVLYIVCFAMFWLALGGWLAIAPTTTTIFFGARDYASNYGIVFTAYGVGAIIGNLVAGQVKDIVGSYTYAFWPTLGLSAVGLIIAFLLFRPIKAPETERARKAPADKRPLETAGKR